MIISMLFYVIRRPGVILPASIIIISVISIFTFFFPQVISERFLSAKNFGADVSSLGRLQAWLSTIELIKENPFYGYGFNSYIYLRDQVYGFYFVLVEHSHNTYLRGMLELGLIGFSLYFFFFFAATYYTFRLMKLDTKKIYRKYLDGLQLSFVGLIVVFMFEPYFSLYGLSAIIIWLMISITFNIKLNFNSYFKTS
jgi:O-antigen ligase